MGRIFFTAANLIDGVNPPQPNTTVVVEGDSHRRQVGHRRRSASSPPHGIRCSTSAAGP